MLNRRGPHALVYETPSGDGTKRHVVKESIPVSELSEPELFPGQARLMVRNEYLALKFVRKHTTIPVPTVIDFLDEPAPPVRLVTEFVENAVCPKSLPIPKDAQKRMIDQLEGYLLQLHAITDPSCRSFVGIPFFSWRLEATGIPIQDYRFRQFDQDSPYVLCHGDIGWQNLLVDPKTFEIKSIVDWEYAGFYPVEVEGEYWRRRGPAGPAMKQDVSDIDKVIGVLYRLKELEGDSKPEDTQNEQGGSRLRHLLSQVRLDEGQTASVGSILSQGVIDSRKTLASTLREASEHLQVDLEHIALVVAEIENNAVVSSPNKLSDMSQDHSSIYDLSRLLPRAFSTLATQLYPSGDPFFPLRDHFSAEADALEKLYDKEKLKALPGSKEEKEESVLRILSREMRMERRNVADQAFKESELQKWKAIKEFATSLLRLSAVAHSLLPYLADHDHEHPAPQTDAERAFAEVRAYDVSRKGGSGGWTVEMKDDEALVAEMKKVFLKDWEDKKEERDKFMKFRHEGRDRGQREYEMEDKRRIAEREKLRSLIKGGSNSQASA